MYVPLQTIHRPLDRVHEYESQCDEILRGNVARRSKYCQNMLLTDDVIGTVMNALNDGCGGAALEDTGDGTRVGQA